MLNYPKVLRKKDLKKIEKYPCDEEIKEAYKKYLTNYSFEEFAVYCEDNSQKDLESLIFKFSDLQLDKFEPNSIIWLSHVLMNFMIYFNVNMDYERYYDAYATALQFSVLSMALKMIMEKVSFEEVSLLPDSINSFKEFFTKCPDFEFDLKKDSELAYKSFNQDFGFSSQEFYEKVKEHFESEGYL